MSQLRLISVLALGIAGLLSLANQLASPAATKPAPSIQTTNVDAPVVNSDTVTPISTTDSTVLVTQATGNLLSSEQKATLTRLPIPIVAPTDLPAGFRLMRAEGGTSQYVNGDDDSGYAIDYQGENNTCLSIVSSKDGPRRLPKVKQVQTSLGLMTVYMEKYRDFKSFVTFLGIKGNPVLISGGTLPDSTAEGGFKRCRAVSLEAYTQVLKSLAIVK